MRIAKSFTIEPDLSTYVAETKGPRSASERVNRRYVQPMSWPLLVVAQTIGTVSSW